jgi:serine protease AprX
MKSIFIFFLLFLGSWMYSQDLVLVKFNDKPNQQHYYDNPLEMLTQKAIDRRVKYNIPFNIQDVPVEPSYVTQVQNLGVTPIAVSKWFNGVFAWLTESQVSQMEGLPFVMEVESFVQNGVPKNIVPVGDKFAGEDMGTIGPDGTFDFNYGITEEQVKQLKLDYLHNLGFTGEGISIAIMDNGFPGVNTASGFGYIRNNNQIKGGYNFIENNENIYDRGTHGTMVLSTIGGYLENQYVGTAIDADFYLFITENTDHELPDEEVHWISAAERADYLGVDVINTSLGYNEFDDSRYNYTYDDMDGQTAFITRGAQIAAEKGMMVVNSAGNSGNSDWHYITAPADGVDVFTIGAVDQWGIPAGFSSYGPSADGRIKPDVSARGRDAAIIRASGNLDYANGTSFSSPIMAGAMACFIQAHPDEHPASMRQIVRQTASHFNNPTNQLGYGIPNFEVAHNSMMSVVDVSSQNSVSIYPNPTSSILNIQSDKEISGLQLISVEGKLIRKYGNQTQLNMEELPKGVYILKVQLKNGQTEIKKVVKK